MWFPQPPENIKYAALVIAGSFIIEGIIFPIPMFDILSLKFSPPYKLCIHTLGASLIVAIQAVKKGAAAEGMKIRDYVWRGHDPTSVAVMTEVQLLFFTLA